MYFFLKKTKNRAKITLNVKNIFADFKIYLYLCA